MTEISVRRIWFAICEVPVKAEVNSDNNAIVWDSDKKVAEAIVNALFINGELGAEFANYYARHPFPLTARKVRAAMSEYTVSKSLPSLTYEIVTF